jgi:hypothetical protein
MPAPLLAWVRQVTIPPGDQQAEVRSPAAPEAFLELFGVGHLIEFPEPVDDLTQSVLKARRPFRSCFLALLREQAARGRILPRDEAVGLAERIADDEVSTEVAKRLEAVARKKRGKRDSHHAEKARNTGYSSLLRSYGPQ